MSDTYNPVKSLEKEVERFMSTNTFTPMDVTNFYIQARVVLSELAAVTKERDELKRRHDERGILMERSRVALENACDHLQKERDAARAALKEAMEWASTSCNPESDSWKRWKMARGDEQ